MSRKTTQDVRSAERNADLWIGAEDFVRWIENQRPDQYLGRLGYAAFTASDYLEFFGEEDVTRETSMRRFERWKKQWARPVGLLAEDLDKLTEDRVESALVRRWKPSLPHYLIPLPGLAGKVTAALRRRDELAKFAPPSGKRWPTGLVPVSRKKPVRDMPVKKAADALGIAYSRVKSWITKAGAPHRREPHGKRERLFVDLGELEHWSMAAVAEGRIRDYKAQRVTIPAKEARARLSAVRQRLNLSVRRMAEAIGVKKSRLGPYLGHGSGGKKLKVVPLSVVEAAESLVGFMEPLTEYEKRTRRSAPSMASVREALAAAGGSVSRAAKALGVSDPVIRGLAQAGGIPIKVRAGPAWEFISAEDVVDVMSKTGDRITKAAVLLGIGSASLSCLIQHYGLRGQFDIRTGTTKPGGVYTKDELAEAIEVVGADTMAVAKLLDLSDSQVRNLLKSYGMWEGFRSTASPVDEKKRAATETAIHRGIRDGLFAVEVAEILGITPTGLRNRIARYELRPLAMKLRLGRGHSRERRSIKEETELAVKSGVMQGLIRAQVARGLGISVDTLRERARRYGLTDHGHLERAKKRVSGNSPAKQEVFRLLRANGATLLRSKKHLVYALPDGQRHTAPSTPSDPRAWKNNLSHLRIKLRTMESKGLKVLWNPVQIQQNPCPICIGAMLLL